MRDSRAEVCCVPETVVWRGSRAVVPCEYRIAHGRRELSGVYFPENRRGSDGTDDPRDVRIWVCRDRRAVRDSVCDRAADGGSMCADCRVLPCGLSENGRRCGTVRDPVQPSFRYDKRRRTVCSVRSDRPIPFA